MRAHELYGRRQFVLRSDVGMAENYARGAFNLVVEKFTEVLHVHLALVGVDYRRHGIYLRVGEVCALDGFRYVRKFAHARGFNEYPVGMILLVYLLQRLGKIADERTAYAARVELVYGYSRFLHKAAVHAYFSEFVFNEHEFFARVSFLYKLFYERSFARAEETRKNINFNHLLNTSLYYCLSYYITTINKLQTKKPPYICRECPP